MHPPQAAQSCRDPMAEGRVEERRASQAMSTWFYIFGLPLTQCLRDHVLYALVPFLSLSQQDSQHSTVICYLKLLRLAVVVGGRLDFYCSDKAYSPAFTIFLGLGVVVFSVPLPLPYSSSGLKPNPSQEHGLKKFFFIIYHHYTSISFFQL